MLHRVQWNPSLTTICTLKVPMRCSVLTGSQYSQLRFPAELCPGIFSRGLSISHFVSIITILISIIKGKVKLLLFTSHILPNSTRPIYWTEAMLRQFIKCLLLWPYIYCHFQAPIISTCIHIYCHCSGEKEHTTFFWQTKMHILFYFPLGSVEWPYHHKHQSYPHTQ